MNQHFPLFQQHSTQHYFTLFPLIAAKFDMDMSYFNGKMGAVSMYNTQFWFTKIKSRPNSRNVGNCSLLLLSIHRIISRFVAILISVRILCEQRQDLEYEQRQGVPAGEV